ncbi:MAG: family N-acetyltransferase [Rhodocyclaceae bacterium]|nr:family N-acetyltransferase [Rhodocyclaceae bacterium]
MTSLQIPAPTRCINGLEPAALIRHFLAHPPAGFEAFCSPAGMPGFFADFDLLTTADGDTLDLVNSLPGSRWLRRLLNWRTCFFGTTASEYAPLPASVAPEALPPALLEAWSKRSRLLIVKDIPDDSPLLPAADRQYAAAFVAACVERGFILVEGQALAYVPIDFACPEDYLARLSPGRRKDIRRKLRARERLQLKVLPTGCEALRDPDFLAVLYDLYREVYAQSEIHFDLLTPDFFRAILQDGNLDGHLFLYYGDGELIGFNLCFVHDGMLIDKYVGFRYPAARQHNLYFVSWMENLAFARERGLSHYVAGWTDPEIKAYLGARFTFTRHAVYVRNPLLRSLLKRISGRFESDRAWFDAHAKQPAPRP